MSKINLEIQDNFGIITINNTKKTVKLESIIKSFSSVSSAIESPILPTNCIKYKEKGNNIVVLLYHEPTTFNAKVGDEVYENCIRPGVIFKYVLSLNKDTYNLHNSYAFGVKDPYIALNDKTRLFGLPFPNVNSSGSICWGSNSSNGTFNSLVGLKSYCDRFFNSNFNNHLYNSDLIKLTIGAADHKEFFRYLQNKPVFPYQTFEDIGTTTIGSI